MADAYDGEKIKSCIEDFLKAANGQNPVSITIDSTTHTFGGGSDLVAYIGHDGLMEFSVDIKYKAHPAKRLDAIMLACYSKSFFRPEIKKSGANPLLWTTHLMAPLTTNIKNVGSQEPETSLPRDFNNLRGNTLPCQKSNYKVSALLVLP